LGGGRHGVQRRGLDGLIVVFSNNECGHLDLPIRCA
jgi:hypothetical protein